MDGLFLTVKRNEVAEVTEEVAKQAENLGIEAALADKYTYLIYETPYYEGFNKILVDIPNELRSTADFWRNTAKKDLQESLGSIRSFCTSYTSYFPDLIQEILSGAQTIAAKKELMLQYLGELQPKLNKSMTNLKNTSDTASEFLNRVDNHKDKLESTVVPNIANTITENKRDIAANDAALKECRTKINDLDKKRMAAITASVAAGSGLLVSGVAVGVTGTALYLKNVGRVVGTVGEGTAISYGRFGASIIGKIAVGVSVALVIANIIGFAASTALWNQYQQELARLRVQELNLFQTGIDLNADAAYLNIMEKSFNELLSQSTDVVSAFQGFQKDWKTVSLEVDKVDSKLKDLGTQLENTLKAEKIEDDLSKLNTHFSALKKKLERYELNFTLPTKLVEDSKTITALDSQDLLYTATTQWIPNALYSASICRAF